MGFSWKQIEYAVKSIGESRLVWLKPVNRYLQLEEPAFQVFKQFTEGLSEAAIGRNFERQYQIPGEEALRFVAEISQNFQSLFQDYKKPGTPRLPGHADTPAFQSNTVRYMAVSGKVFLFSFGDKQLEQYVFPLFSYLEIFSAEPDMVDIRFEFQRKQGKAYMRVNKKEIYAWPVKHLHRLKGELFMQILNEIHDGIHGKWMGVIHAASVSSGRKAVMFPAQSGGGKSTLASLLMASGCQLLSDDFSPIALKNGYIHAFPANISLKTGSVPVLGMYFPELIQARENPSPSKKGSIRYLKPRQPEPLSNMGFRPASIVFVQYDPQKHVELEGISNLHALNDFLKESWIPDETRVVEKFLDWFFEIPCYTLHYGDNEKAVNTLLSLLNDVP